ncbi:selenocysteine lyase-like isoform X2 [Acanthaster planci]|uniref:Selenocysteine lyase n=1 Tax=Acanthaster planci TaxID=133434 RepID=A0A8B7ZF26_ACAPL|nr:selenocysteine lyase-like isoform X2 [Acanthaster planci]
MKSTDLHHEHDKFNVYLDYNATTPLESEVRSAIHDALGEAWGNPSSSYAAGQKAKQIIEEARDDIASMIGAQKEDIIFTSGGTEANNMVIHTAVKHFWKTFPLVDQSQPVIEDGPPNHGKFLPHVITSNLEHDSVKLVLEHLVDERQAVVTFVPASKLTGHVEVSDIVAALRPATCLISIMHANNEIGVIQPIAEICRRIRAVKRDPKREVPRVLLHTDAAQTIGKVDVNVEELGVDYLTVVGHKFYGPRIGAVFVKGGGVTTPLYPMLYGGGQERNFRPGTENTGMIAGLGKAAELVCQNLEKYEVQMREVRDYLEDQLQNVFGDGVHFNSRFPSGSARIPNTCNVSFLGPGLEGYKLLQRVTVLQASVGAACHSECHSKPSHILLAVGIPSEVAANALRLSVGRQTTKEDIDRVVDDLKQAVATLKAEMN